MALAQPFTWTGREGAFNYSECVFQRSFTFLTILIVCLVRLSHDKPSAIFRLRGTFSSETSLNHTAFHADPTLSSDQASSDVTAILGIAIEPLQTILTQLPAQTGSAGPKLPVNDAPLLAEKIAKHLFNYISSFTSEIDYGSHSLASQNLIRLDIIRRWYESFMSKLRGGGISFLDREEA